MLPSRGKGSRKHVVLCSWFQGTHGPSNEEALLQLSPKPEVNPHILGDTCDAGGT